jgi:release factor glutamine methyltransferase
MTARNQQTLADWQRWARVQLAGSDSPQLDADIMLAHALRQPRSYLLANTAAVLSAGDAGQFASLVARRARGEPVAYILGFRDFWSLRLTVKPAVLIPRPETELVVERALALRDQSAARVADLGTGSGAIALACASERPLWQVLGTDASAAALEVAEGNRAALKLGNVQWRRGHWCQALPGAPFDLILSNPPYIARGDPALADPALQCEPAASLVSGPAGLDDLQEIIRDAWAHLQPGGALVLEHGASQAAAVAQMLVETGYAHVRCHPDLAGLDRVTAATKE